MILAWAVATAGLFGVAWIARCMIAPRPVTGDALVETGHSGWLRLSVICVFAIMFLATAVGHPEPLILIASVRWALIWGVQAR